VIATVSREDAKKNNIGTITTQRENEKILKHTHLN